MKLRALTTIACPLGVWHRGDTLDVPDAMGESLLAVAAAEPLEKPKRPKPAPPVEPEPALASEEIETATAPVEPERAVLPHRRKLRFGKGA
jgi:hypothetical protein